MVCIFAYVFTCMHACIYACVYARIGVYACVYMCTSMFLILICVCILSSFHPHNHHLSPNSPRLMFLFVHCATVNKVHLNLSYIILSYHPADNGTNKCSPHCDLQRVCSLSLRMHAQGNQCVTSKVALVVSTVTSDNQVNTSTVHTNRASCKNFNLYLDVLGNDQKPRMAGHISYVKYFTHWPTRDMQSRNRWLSPGVVTSCEMALRSDEISGMTRGPSQYKDRFPSYEDPHVKDKTFTRPSYLWYRIPILVRRHVYIETAPRLLRVPQNTVDMWMLVQVMAWCRQANESSSERILIQIYVTMWRQ